MTTPDLPLGWQRAEVRRFARVRTGKTVASVPSSPGDVQAPYITAAHIQPLGRLVDVDGKVMWFSSQELRELDLRQDDLLVVEGGAGYGRPALVAESLSGWGFQNHVNRIRSLAHVSPRYLYYVFEHLLASGATEVASAGATIPTLSAEKVRGLTAAFPRSSEQAIITAFLDRETAQIDAMIEAQCGLVASLEERKAAISTAIIWGANSGDGRRQVIDPAPPVPSHWQVLRNKWLYRESEELSETGEEELLTVSHITGVTLRSDKNVTMTEAESTEGYRIVHVRDLVINTLWGWMGALGVSALNGIVSPAYGVYRPTRPELDPAFMHHLYRSAPYVCEIQRRSTGIWSSRLRIYPKVFLDMPTVLPPLEEQREIGARLTDATKQMDRTIEAANAAIALMQDRRSALISAAVTGRIDPRTGMESTPETVPDFA